MPLSLEFHCIPSFIWQSQEIDHEFDIKLELKNVQHKQNDNKQNMNLYFLLGKICVLLQSDMRSCGRASEALMHLSYNLMGLR